MNLLLRLLLRIARPYDHGHLHHADKSLYMERFVLFETKWFSARLHHICTEDRDPHLHDHPWNFCSVLLQGYYVENRPVPVENCRWAREWNWANDMEPTVQWPRIAPSIAFRRATDRHLISYVEPGTWTLFIYGRICQRWGFYTPRGKVDFKEYISSKIHLDACEREMKHHAEAQ
jgi:hypothetical protein